VNVNLRKAAKIEQQIAEKLNVLERDIDATTLTLNGYDDPIVQVDEKLAEFENKYEVIRELSIIRLRMRTNIGKVNAEVGIDRCLAKLAYANKRLTYLNSYSNASARKSSEYLNGIWEDYKSPKETGVYSRNIAPTVHFLNDDMISRIQEDLNSMRVIKSETEDELLSLNVNNTICIENDEIRTLNANGVFF